MPDPSLQALRSFVMVAHTLHFGQAARRLFLSTSALSQQISRLEAAVQGNLFVRTSRSVELTDLGRELLPLARQVVDAYDRLNQWGQSRGAESLRLGCGQAGPAPLTSELFSSYEELGLVLIHVDHDDGLAGIRSGHLDMILLWAPVSGEDLVVAELCLEDPFVWISTRHPLARAGGGVTIGDLVDVPALVPRSTDEDWVEFATLGAGRPGRPPRGPVSEPALERVNALVASGQCFFVVPRTISEHFQHPDIVALPLVGEPRIPFSAVIHREGAKRRAHEAFDRAVVMARRQDTRRTSSDR